MNPFVADPQWGWWIVLYFYLGGIAAGAYFLATLIELFGRDEDRTLSRIGYRLAFPLVLVCGLLLTIDLERPERFYHMLLQSEVVDQALEEGWPGGGWGTMLGAVMFKWWSPMSIGAWALTVFGLFSGLSFLGTLWPGGRLEHWLVRGLHAKIFHMIGGVVGFFIASYTGVLLTASNQPLWTISNWTGPLFLASAGSTGISAVLLLSARARGVGPESHERLERADLWSLGLELFVFLIFLASVGPVLPFALQTVAGLVLVVGTLGVGLLLPLWLHLGVGRPDARRITAAAVSALVGGFALRYGIVHVAPQLLRLWHGSAAELAPKPWHAGVVWGLLAVTVLLAVAIPWLLRRQWNLNVRQTALAGLVSVLVTAGVALYAFRPETARADFRLVGLPGFSPELGRPRGGGFGGSFLNRPPPERLQLRTKITGEIPHGR